MQKITVGSKNQIVIPKEVRQKISGLKPGRVVSVYAVDQNTVAIKVSERSWLESGYGTMKKSWSKAQTQVEKMRDEWNEE